MSEEIINKICELLSEIIEQNEKFDWNMVSALGTWITPIIGAVISYFLGRKIEKQKNAVSQANSATLNIFKEKLQFSSDDIYIFIKACITVNTKQVSEFFELSIDDTIAILNKMKDEGKIRLFSSSQKKEKWVWQII